MSERPEQTRRRLPPPRRLLYSAVTALVVLVTIELVSLAGLWFVDDRIDFPDLHDDQEQRSAGFDDNAPEPLDEVLHPYLGWVLNADQSAGVKVARKAVTVNQFGFRDQGDVFAPLRKGHQRVAVLGGSVAWYLSLDQPGRLKDRFDTLGAIDPGGAPIYDVIPLALSGYKQPQQLMTLSYLLALGAEFDVVVNIDGFNEVALHPAENNLKKVFVAYPRRWHERVSQLPRSEIVHTLYRHASLRLTRRAWADWFSSLPYRYSPTLNLVWRCRDNVMRRQLDRDLETITTGWLNRSRVYMHTGPRRTYEDDDAMYDDLVELWKRCSRQMHLLCRANGIRYVHVLQPNQYFEGSKPMGPEEKLVAFDPKHKYRTGVINGYPRLIKAGTELKEQGVEFLDLTMLFSEIEDAIYIDNCCHYNDRGNSLLAGKIADHIDPPKTDY